MRLWGPPKRLSLSQWADEKRYIPREENPTGHGKWRTDRAEYQRGMMDAITDPSIETIVLYTSSRIGKTSILENALGYYIDFEPCPILVVQPTDQDSRDWSKDSLATMIRDTPCLAEKVIEAKAKTGDNTIVHKKFPGGYLKAVGANSPRGFRRTTIRLLLADEVDAYPPTAGPEGDPLGLAKKRTLTVWNRKIVLASTPTISGASNIEDEWNRSDQRHYYVPCPKCGEYQVLIFWHRSQFAHLSKGFLAFEKNDPLSARYVCGHCQAKLTEGDKHWMVARGEWRATRPEVKGVAGFHINELYSTFSEWSRIAQEWINTGEGRYDEKLRIFINTTLGETYIERESYTVDKDALIARVEKYKQVPRRAVVLVGSTDVQEDRVECMVKAWGPGEESWLIDYERIPGSPEKEETWKKVLEYFSRTYRHESGVELPVKVKLIDSGYETHSIYRFVRSMEHLGYLAIKGRGGPPEKRGESVSKPSRTQRERALLMIVYTDELKQSIYTRLRLQTEGPGYMHFNQRADEEYFRQLTSERRDLVWKDGHRKFVWRLMDRHTRNEVLDCTVYSLAGFRYLRMNVEWAARRIQEEAEKTAKQDGHPEAKQQEPPLQPPKRKRFLFEI